MAPALTTRRTKKKREGRRSCRICEMRLIPNGAAVRVSDVQEWARPVGRTRYWLCRSCAVRLDNAITQVMQKVGA